MNKLYLGYTANLKKRFTRHNTNKSNYTKNKGPWMLINYESYGSREDAKNREYRLKHYGQAYNELKKRIAGSLLLAN
jgi:predicted GIY-YIG superfamily endonuclease